MAEPLIVSARVVVPAPALRWRAARAGGPGGQNVNKVASKVELRVDLDRVEGLSPAQRARLAALAAPRLDADGHLLVVSQLTRDQVRNLEDARAKVRDLIGRALPAPIPRIPTRPGRGAKARRVAAKQQRGARKRDRTWRPDEG